MIKFLIAYLLVHIATYFLIVHKLAKGHLKNKDNQELKKRFGPFCRNDLDNWHWLKTLPFYMFFWPRFILGWINTLFYSTFTILCMLGVKDAHEVGPVRKFLVSAMGLVCCRLHCFLGGLYWSKIEYVSTGEGDYRKWLGKDWKPEWKGSGTIVANHVCWMDICYTLAYFFPSFVSKKEVRNIPGIGLIAMAIDCVFLDRAGTKEEKIKAAETIENRQQENERTGRSPVLIFPEGATTNNEQVIKFKRGAFSGLHSVQPMAFKYWSLNGISPQNDTISMYMFFFSQMSAFTTLHLKVYPVFKPNDYFWEHHWSESSGEQKWEAYARVVREQIIAKSFGFSLRDDVQMEDKFEFKDIMKGKKPKTKKEE